jgi:flagellar protein FliO/FliZ
MTWMVVRLVLSLVFIGAVLWFAARFAQKRGLGQGNGLIEVVARQRMGRASSVSVVRIADRVLVVGSTEEQVTLLAEVDGDVVEEAIAERRPATAQAAGTGTPGALAGSVFDRNGWTTFVSQLRERTVRR